VRRALAGAARWLGLALALCGCAALGGVKDRVTAREPATGPATTAFEEVRQASSRRDSLYDGLDHRADLSGTWLSSEVRLSASRQLAEWQGWSEAELQKAQAADLASGEKGEEFVLAVYTAERKHNDLDAKPSIWHIELDDGTQRAAAASVETVTADATVLQLFPYVGPFDQVYRVFVPWKGRPLTGRPFLLRVASALGALELDFGPKGERPRRPHGAP
jgi:hypothetical protein